MYNLLTVSKSLERVFQDYRIKKNGFNEWEKSVRAGDGFQEDMPRERQSNKGIFQERNVLTAEIFIIYFASLLEEL